MVQPPPKMIWGIGPISPRDDDGQSLSNVRGVINREDASTQCDNEEMAIRRQPPHTGKDWSKQLSLSTDGRVISWRRGHSNCRSGRIMATYVSIYGASRAHQWLWVTVCQRLTHTLPPRYRYQTSYHDTVYVATLSPLTDHYLLRSTRIFPKLNHRISSTHLSHDTHSLLTLRYIRKQPSMRPTYVNGTLTTHKTLNCGTGWRRKWMITPTRPNQWQFHVYIGEQCINLRWRQWTP